jgi:hypothetical protein
MKSMKIAILTFDGFNEIDSIVAAAISIVGAYIEGYEAGNQVATVLVTR